MYSIYILSKCNNETEVTLICILVFYKINNVLNVFISSKQATIDGSLDNTETNDEDTAMESDISERAIGIAYSLVNTCLSQLCECYA